MSVEELVRSPVFAKLPTELTLSASPFFERRELRAGTTLWYEEHLANELAVVISGGLRAKVGVQEVGEIRAGELVGETSVFITEPRSATVEATSDTVLYVLDQLGLNQVADTLPTFYDHLLDRALQEMARRVRATDLKIALIAAGTDEPPPTKPASSFLRALRRLGTAMDDARTPVLPSLRAMPGMKDAPATLLGEIAQAMTPRTVDLNTAVFLEGDTGESAFVIAEGEVKVLRNVKGGRARRLATLGRGAIFGTGSLLLGERRNASVVTVSAAKLFELNTAGMEGLAGPAGRLWRTSLLHALRKQVLGASTHLAELKGGTSWSDRERLRAAASKIVAFQVDEDPWVIDGRVR